MKSPVPPLPTPGTCRAGVGPVPRATPGLGGGKVGSTHWGPCLPQPTRGCCGGERGTGCKRWRAVGSGAQGGDAPRGALLPSPSDLRGGGGLHLPSGVRGGGEGNQGSIGEELLCGPSLASECFPATHISCSALSPSLSLFPPHAGIANWIQGLRRGQGRDSALNPSFTE